MITARYGNIKTAKSILNLLNALVSSLLYFSFSGPIALRLKLSQNWMNFLKILHSNIWDIANIIKKQNLTIKNVVSAGESQETFRLSISNVTLYMKSCVNIMIAFSATSALKIITTMQYGKTLSLLRIMSLEKLTFTK